MVRRFVPRTSVDQFYDTILYAVDMQVILPEQALPAKLTLNPELPMNDEEYYKFCMANRDLRFERTAQRDIIIVPPAGFESDYRSLDVGGQLREWAMRDGRGKAFGSSAEFILPTGAALSPDAAWVSNHRIAEVPKEQRRKFPRICPEFVVEVMSPGDRLRAAQEKMEEWIRAGVELAWLIRAEKRTVYVYRAGQTGAEERIGILKIAGQGPVDGFELDLASIWAGL
jgi:Uma2 family endonuclease